ncbi:MAG: DUF11 domain-containing protein [Clostridia bacterium]|nr:DUF11 domain-containing protein [Clostridia bacterium]
MATITSINNIASASFNGNTIESNNAVTQLILDPTVSKSVDKATASIGEVLTYSINITNDSELEMSNVVFSDNVPVGSNYITNSFTVNGTSVTPTVTGTNLSYNISSIPASSNTTVSFQVIVIGGEA